jgi:hypothetical protein
MEFISGAYRDVAHPECQLTQNRSSGPTFVVNWPQQHHRQFAPSMLRPRMACRRDGHAGARECAGSVAAGGTAKQLHSNTYPLCFFFVTTFVAFQALKMDTTTAYFCAKETE